MAKKKMTILDFQKFKDEGRKFAFCTAYDYTTATIVDESDVEIILVGDSLGMIMLGYDTTVPVTVDDMIHHIKPVVKGAPNTFIIGDMPFGSYNVSPSRPSRPPTASPRRPCATASSWRAASTWLPPSAAWWTPASTSWATSA